MKLRRKSRQKLLMTAVVLLVTLYWWQGSNNADEVNATKSEVKVILSYPPSSDQAISMERCRVNRCIVANDMALYNDSHAFVVDASHFTGQNDLPTHRPTHQQWFIRRFQSPLVNASHIQKYNGIFNGAISYTTKAQVYVPFGHVRSFLLETEPVKDYHATKTNLIAWMPDTCESESKRERYVFKLADHMQIDTFGVCGKSVCGGENQTESEGDNCDAKEVLGRSYMFYLAFENVLCSEYITGELWDALRNNMVPVIMAEDDIYELLPEGAFIDIKDFDGPASLAEYIESVSKNASAYNEFHEWRRSFFVPEPEPWQCALCEELHSDAPEWPIIDNMEEVWASDDWPGTVSLDCFHHDSPAVMATLR